MTNKENEANTKRISDSRHDLEQALNDAERERKIYEKALEDEVAALRNIHEALGSGAWKLQYNEQGEMISCRWSDTMRKMLGFSSTEDFPDEFEAWSDRLHPDELHETGEKLNRALKETEDAESANEAKNVFLLNMSHDIRTPMNAILGYSRLMRERLIDPELLHYQEMIEQSGNLLLSILNNVLDMARIESGKAELDENYSRACP